ncbi:chemokine XC receptor 1 [Melanotaenia boesemani]|uniref:chemokine XC receptor 1 n=1 Tax=Melanotaenia boesemani TaxID=1250792 RepID=UPI001C042EC3|nr:chemokine XC receptor 1 [Melanotaenia boesemani]
MGEMTTVENNMDYDYESDLCNKTSVIHFGAIVTPVFFSIVMILSLIGNILVLLILVKYENLKSITNTLILNLVVSDLFFSAGLPFWTYYHMYGWTLGESACKIVSFIFHLGFYSSSIILILMTAYRYVAVINPLSNIVSATGLYSIISTVVIWIMSILAASPALIFSKIEGQYYCGYMEQHLKLLGVYLQNAVFVLSSLVFVFCYSQILYKLMRPTPQRRNKTLKLIFILIVVFFVGWAPYNVVIFLQSIFIFPGKAEELFANPCKTSQQLDYAFYISRLLAFSHCCLNPVFYVFVAVKFKTHLKKMLKSWCHTKRGQNKQNRVTIISLTSGEDFCV